MRLASSVPLRPEEGTWARGDGALLIGDQSWGVRDPHFVQVKKSGVRVRSLMGFTGGCLEAASGGPADACSSSPFKGASHAVCRLTLISSVEVQSVVYFMGLVHFSPFLPLFSNDMVGWNLRSRRMICSSPYNEQFSQPHLINNPFFSHYSIDIICNTYIYKWACLWQATI